MSDDKLIVSAYGSHNGGIAAYHNGKYIVVEAERFLNEKNIGIGNYMPSRYMQTAFDSMMKWVLEQTGREVIDIYMEGYMANVEMTFPYKATAKTDHHEAHAACSFYQSPFNESLVITFDGGGDASYFNIYKASRKTGITLVKKYSKDLGFPYMVLADYLEDIRKEALSIGNLVYAGKLMGLCSYGNVRDEWLPHFAEFYDKFDYSGDAFIGGSETSTSAISQLMSDIGVDDFDPENDRFSGQFAWDIAATTQRAFEEMFLKLASPHIAENPHLPVCLAGGCALNVLLNTRLLESGIDVFIPPNTNDCGIAVGNILAYTKPQSQVDLTYAGLPLMDADDLPMMVQDRSLSMVEDVTLQDIAKFLSEGQIIGIIQGQSEHGSRALGNRSILCDPKDGMKDALNQKVKHREWYRPFAPVVRLEDVNKYFHWDRDTESRHMTFVATVREEWRHRLSAITHEDGSARLQTVTRHQNEGLYDTLTHFEEKTGQGVLLNTSFNDNGKPILTRLSDAISLLRNSELDAVYYDSKLICITPNLDKFKTHKKEDEENALEQDTTFVLFMADKYADKIDDLSKMRQNGTLPEKTIILCSENMATLLGNTFDCMDIIGDSRYYYAGRIHDTPDVDFDEHEVHARYLWAKETATSNPYNTNWFLFLNFGTIEGREESILTNPLWLSFMQDSTECREGEEVIMSASKTVDGALEPADFFVGGSIEGIVWFSNYFEAMVLGDLKSRGDTPPPEAIEHYLSLVVANNKTKVGLKDCSSWVNRD